jgi:glycosyltransferase involved in cell wall biosynthesis
MPLFSVVIPTYNRRELLRQTLESVWKQAFEDFEVIVVDDGSTDGTLEELRSLGSRVGVLQQANRGPGAARNLGVTRARGEYLAFLDSDDLWFPWTLGVFARLIEQHKWPAILSAKLVEFAAGEELADVREQPPEVEVFEDYLSSSHRACFVGAGMSVLRREAFQQSGGYRDGYANAEDHDLILRLGTAKGFVQIRNPVTLAWRRHSGSATVNFRRSFEGGVHLIEQERRGVYPGGGARARERREIITRHIRPTTLACLREGLRAEAWELYRATFRWHLALGRWKFLAGFPLKAMFAARPMATERAVKE